MLLFLIHYYAKRMKGCGTELLAVPHDIKKYCKWK